jgi:putative membrane protein
MASRKNIYNFLIILFHVVGLIGFLYPPLTALFLKLVPYHLLLMFLLLSISKLKETTGNLYIMIILTFVAGYLIEVIGVKTGRIFGNYWYGSTLGFKLADVPLLIGINWVLLIYGVGVTVEAFRISSRIFKAILGAFMLVLLDFLIEPIAVKFDYWHWEANLIPLQNYVGWFLVSFTLLCLFNFLKFKKENQSAIVLLVTQFVFFLALNFWAL